jgi:hypothetical protein
MRITRTLAALAVAGFFSVGSAHLLLLPGTSTAVALATATTPDVAVGPQYDTTHVYVAPDQFDRFVASVLATFGGTTSKKVVTTVTPTPSSTFSQLILTPVGTISVFGFTTPIPYPFGAERTGYLVTDMNAALSSARAAGADVIVTPFDDPIGMDVIIQWPGGIDMQLYSHNTPPSYKTLETIPENRVYVSPDRADAFIRSFLAFSHGKMIADDRHASASDIGLPNDTFRRVRIESAFGKVTVLVTAARLPSPYRREITGYEVAKLGETIAKAKNAGVIVLVPPYESDQRQAAMVQFPGGYIAEIHSPAHK